MYGNPNVSRRLPPESEMDRDDALDAFVAIVNTARPDHPYQQNPWPVDRDAIKFGVTRSCYARCGPLKNYRTPVLYKTRMSYINGIDRPRHLALMTHEITHIKDGTHNHSSGHPPEFWREMAFYALEIRDAIEDGVLEPVFGDVDVDAYLEKVARDPISGTVDRRSWSVEEARENVADLINVDLGSD